MKVTALLKLVVLGMALIASTAQAELQTWRFTGTVYQQNTGFMPPDFAKLGQELTVDYLFDTVADIGSATKSVTFDGQTSQVYSSNLNQFGGSLSAINVRPISSRSDGVTFLSFNYFDAPPSITVSEYLNNYSAAVMSSNSFLDLRIDFGNYSVWANPSSFSMTSSVPEPESYVLVLIGLGLIGFVARSRKISV